MPSKAASLRAVGVARPSTVRLGRGSMISVTTFSRSEFVSMSSTR